MTRVISERNIRRFTKDREPSPIEKIALGGCRRVLGFAEQTLAGRPYFGGPEFTTADIMMVMSLRMAPLVIEGMTDTGAYFRSGMTGRVEYPHIAGFLDRVMSRPAFERAMARTMPDGPPPF